MWPSRIVSGTGILLLLAILCSVVCHGFSFRGQGFVFTKTEEMKTVPLRAKGQSLRARPGLRTAPWILGGRRARMPLAPGGKPLLLDERWCWDSAVLRAVSGDGEVYSKRLQRAVERLEKALDELDAAEDADSVDTQLVAELKLRVAEAKVGVAEAKRDAASEEEKAGLQVSVAEAKVGVAEAKRDAASEEEKAGLQVSVAEAKVGVAEAKRDAASEEEKAGLQVQVAKAELGVAVAKWQGAPEGEKDEFLKDVEIARKAWGSFAGAMKQGAQKLLEPYKFTPKRNPEPEFSVEGFGPFVVERKELRTEIISWTKSVKRARDGTVHISGAKACGKTTLLRLVGEDLLKDGKTVYYFENSQDLNGVLRAIREFDKDLDERVFFLVDETQANAGSSPFTFLLKNANNIVMIGAGVPDYGASSEGFSLRLQTSKLFITEEGLRKEGVIDYFVGGDTTRADEVAQLVSHVWQDCGGHIFPLMRLSELLVPRILVEGASAEDCINTYDSKEFRNSSDFNAVCRRILPDVGNYDLLSLFRGTPDQAAVNRLQRAGFCDSSGRIISRLLADAYLASVSACGSIISDLAPGVEGIEQVLRFGLPRIQWEQYVSHGGPVENALTFELLYVVATLAQIGARLFDPKLVDAGTSARRPDMFLNSIVNSYLEALLTRGNSADAKKSLNEHISRFYESPNNGSEPHYKLQHGQDFAVLHFQNWGSEPLKPSDKWTQAFGERVFTYIMPTRQLFRGDMRVDNDPTAASSV